MPIESVHVTEDLAWSEPEGSDPAGRMVARRRIAYRIAVSLLAATPKPTPSQALLGEQLLAIGTEADAATAFGEITGLAVDTRGRIIVLDGKLGRLIAFDRHGSLLSSLGRPGNGPGEFAVPATVLAFGEDSLLVLDAAQRRLSVITVVGDSLRLSGSVSVSVTPHGACQLSRSLFLLTSGAERLVHQIGATGSVTREFGEPLVSGNRAGGTVVNRGKLACFPHVGLVLLVSHLRPLVRAYSARGQLRWQHQLRGFRSAGVVETATGGVEVRRNSRQGDHFIASLWQVDDTTAAIQFGRMDDRYGRSRVFNQVETRFLHLGSGREIGASSTIPVISTVVGDRVYVVSNDPFPQVRVYRRWRPH